MNDFVEAKAAKEKMEQEEKEPSIFSLIMGVRQIFGKFFHPFIKIFLHISQKLLNA